jgi:hypothetical protein
MKWFLGIIAILLTVVGYYPYIRDVIKGKTKPHVYSWALFALITLTAFALQFQGEAGLGCYATLASTVLILTVVGISFFKNGHTDVTAGDKVFIALTIISLCLWVFAEQPIISTILITITDLFAYGPMLRKSWHLPHTETPSFFVINAFRFLIILFSLETYSLVTYLYPAAELSMQTFLASMIYVRRQHVLNTI